MKPNAIIDRFDTDDRGVSPVIGVILMVAITVILAAVIGTFVLDLGQSAGNSAPSASLTVSTDASEHHFNVSHKGGDTLNADSTRVIITNESSGTSQTYTAASDSNAFEVGETVGFNTSSQSTDWTLQGPTGGQINVSSGTQYTVQFIDTESQRVIFETTVTA